MTLPIRLPPSLGAADLAALALLLIAWILIGRLTEHPPAGRPSVSVLMRRYRREWMRHFVAREPRIFDSNILASLREGTAFFASASMIAIGGALALIGNTDRLRGLARQFELEQGTALIWEIKLLPPLFFMVIAFLRFVWAHRLFGYCAILMGAVPNDAGHTQAQPRAAQAAELNIAAARSFNAGLRCVYFALGSMGWLAGPPGLAIGALIVLSMTWRREFASHSRQVLLDALPQAEMPAALRDRGGADS